MKYIDAHLHYVDSQELELAFKNGMQSFFMNSTSPLEWQSILDITQKFNGYACLGIHPWYIDKVYSGWDEDLAHFLSVHPSSMIGEIGVDRNRGNLEQQIEIFKTQVDIALKYKRAIHVHVVKAWDIVEKILRGFKFPILFHRFSSSSHVVSLFGENAYFSVVSENKFIPKNKILTESDAPYYLKSSFLVPKNIEKKGLNGQEILNNTYRFLEQSFSFKSA